jgi:hypothetical protein
MPVLIVSLNTSPQVGFSRKRSIRPVSSSAMTMPKASGFSTEVSAIVASAPRSSCERTAAPRSKSVSTSPLITMTRSSMISSPALRTAPAVP